MNRSDSYAPLAGAGAGAGAGYGAGYAQNAGYAQQQGYRDSGYSRGESMTADEIWAHERGVPPPTNNANNNYYSSDAATKSGKKKMWWFIGIAALIIAIVVGVVVGVVVSRNSKNSSASSKGNGGAALSDPNDPSNFEPDGRLHKSFWGMCYEPQNSQYDNCAVSQTNVTRDIQILSQLTSRVRLYGANCNVTATVLQAIRDTKVDMKLYAAIYVDSNEQAYEDQLEAILTAIDTYGPDHFGGIAVGNEFLLNAVPKGGSNSSAAYPGAVQKLTAKIQEVDSKIKAKGYTIPIGTGDAGSMFSVALADEVDFYMSNVHPWFGELPVELAGAWTYDYFHWNNEETAAASTRKPDVYIAETGWPSNANATEFLDNGLGAPAGEASIANLQTFLDTYICQANQNGTGYFYFEAFDQPWKMPLYGGIEPYWGLFDADRNLKELTIPDCASA